MSASVGCLPIRGRLALLARSHSALRCRPRASRFPLDLSTRNCLSRWVRQVGDSKTSKESQTCNDSKVDSSLDTGSQDNRSGTKTTLEGKHSLAIFRKQSTFPKPRKSHIRRHWTQADLDSLHELRAKGLSLGAIAQSLERTIHAVQGQLERGTFKESTRRPWCEDEIRRLLQLKADGHSERSIMTHFPGRSVSAVLNQIRKVSSGPETKGLAKPWNKESVTTLCYLRDTLRLSWLEVAQRMDRSMISVMRRYRNFKGTPSQIHSRWSEVEDQNLLELRKSGRTFDDIAKELPGRTSSATKQRFRELMFGCVRESDVKVEERIQN